MSPFRWIQLSNTQHCRTPPLTKHCEVVKQPTILDDNLLKDGSEGNEFDEQGIHAPILSSMLKGTLLYHMFLYEYQQEIIREEMTWEGIWKWLLKALWVQVMFLGKSIKAAM